MAHDKNGTPLNVGDTVCIAAEITSICPGDDYCNLTVVSKEGRKPDGNKETFTLNAAVVEKVASAEGATEDAPAEAATE